MGYGGSFFQGIGRASIPSGVITGAKNGASLSGADVVLGNDIGALLAALLSNREIPTNGFDLRMSGAGNLVVGSNAGLTGKLQVIGTNNGVQQLTKLPVGQVIANAFYQVLDSANVKVFEMRAISFTNLFLGADAGKNLTTGFLNTGIGNGSVQPPLGSVTTGNENTAVGSRALTFNVNGSGNTAVGDASLMNNISGNENTAMGQDCLSQGTTLFRSIAMGVNAGKGVAGFSNFARNVMLGSFSFNQATAGDDNVAIGYLAAGCQAGAAAHGAGNVVIGAAALSNMPMGARNIIIGFQSHVGATVGNDVIAIGVTCVASANNTTLVGNTMNSAIANIAAIATATQNLIVGQTAIAADNGKRLQVNGGISFDDVAAFLHSVTSMNDGAGVGIGTLTNAPAAGNPTKWIPFDDNGTTRFIPAW